MGNDMMNYFLGLTCALANSSGETTTTTSTTSGDNKPAGQNCVDIIPEGDDTAIAALCLQAQDTVNDAATDCVWTNSGKTNCVSIARATVNQSGMACGEITDDLMGNLLTEKAYLTVELAQNWCSGVTGTEGTCAAGATGAAG